MAARTQRDGAADRRVRATRRHRRLAAPGIRPVAAGRATSWSSPAASHPPPPGAPTPAGGRWSRSIPSTTSTTPTARTCSPAPASRRRTGSGCWSWAGATRWRSRCWPTSALGGTVPDSLADVPDLISVLLESLLRDAPSEAHMVGLATCARAWLTTEDLLRKTVGAGRAGGVGVAAPPAVRGLPAERADPARSHPRRPGRGVRAPLAGAVPVAAPGHPRPRGRRYPRDDRPGPPAARPATGVPAPAQPAHRRLLRAAGAGLGRRRAGPAGGVRAAGRRSSSVARAARSAALAERWFADQPDRTSVVRTEDGIVGFAYHIFCPTGSTMEDRDPVVRAVLELRGAHRADPARRAGRHHPVRRGGPRVPARHVRGARRLGRPRSSTGAPSRSPGRS